MTLKRPITIVVIATLLVLLGFTRNAVAVPSGEELLNACQRALRTNFNSRDSRMCTWYVTPCDCSFGEPAKLPRVCIPKDTPTRKLATQVTAVIEAIPSYRTVDADLAAAEILAVIYPCE